MKIINSMDIKLDREYCKIIMEDPRFQLMADIEYK